MKNGILCVLILICCICNVGFGQAILEKVPALGTTMRFDCTQLNRWDMKELRYEMIVSCGDRSAVSDLPYIEVSFEYPNPTNNEKYRLEVREEDDQLLLATLKQHKCIGEPLQLEEIPSGSEMFKWFEKYMLGETDSAVVRKTKLNTQIALHDSFGELSADSRTVLSVNNDEETPFGAGRLFMRVYSAQGISDVKVVACVGGSEQSVAR